MYVGSKYYLLAIIWFWLNNLFQWCLSIPSYESLFWVTDPCHSPKLLLPRPILASYQELALTSHYTGWWWLTLVIAWHKSLMSQHQLQVWLLISTLWASTEIIWGTRVTLWHVTRPRLFVCIKILGHLYAVQGARVCHMSQQRAAWLNDKLCSFVNWEYCSMQETADEVSLPRLLLSSQQKLQCVSKYGSDSEVIWRSAPHQPWPWSRH